MYGTKTQKVAWNINKRFHFTWISPKAWVANGKYVEEHVCDALWVLLGPKKRLLQDPGERGCKGKVQCYVGVKWSISMNQIHTLYIFLMYRCWWAACPECSVVVYEVTRWPGDHLVLGWDLLCCSHICGTFCSWFKLALIVRSEAKTVSPGVGYS